MRKGLVRNLLCTFIKKKLLFKHKISLKNPPKILKRGYMYHKTYNF